MPAAVIVMGAILVVVVLVLAAGASRLHSLSRRVGSFSCNARASASPPPSFAFGVALYAVGRIDWYRCWSLSLRPARTWYRERLTVVGRTPISQEGQPDQYLIACRYDGVDFELVMSVAAYAGLASWLEAAPPGRRDLVL